ncbi:MAG: antibiotic biosynthesis monooxygenase family protein [Desulfocapsaceae bacterium]
MYAVIFRAATRSQDEEYVRTVKHMRELAISRYGCLDFVAVTEENQEIAISYWRDEESIHRWKQDAAHRIAQELGKSKWYESYSVEVVEIKRHYRYPEK